MQIKLNNKPQVEFLNMPHKFRAYVAGYGSGKSVAGSLAICQHAWEHPGVNMGYFSPTYGQIRDIFFPTIDEVAAGMNLNVEIKESNKEVHFYSGKKYRATCICRSLDRPQTIVGFKIGHAMIDELDVMPADKAEIAWRKIIARMRDNTPGVKNGIDVTTTPEGFRTTHKLFVAAVQENPALADNYGLIQASTHDNAKNLPADYIPSLYETYPAELADAYINGKFCNLTSGTVYRNYTRKRHASTEQIIDNEALMIGMDFNVQHMAAAVFVVRENGWHAVAELKDIFDTPDMIQIIKDRWQSKGHKIIVYPDASGGSRKTVDASRSDIALLEQSGFVVRCKASNPAVKDRVQSVNKQFECGRLWVNAKNCPTIAKCLESQAYDDNGEPDKKSGFDHMNDAAGYPISFEFPIVKPIISTKISFSM